MGHKRDGLLVVNFGSSYPKTRRKAIGAVQACFEREFPKWEVRRAYTSPTILRKLKREGVETDSLSEAVERMASEGFSRVLVQPTYVVEGFEYDGMVRILEAYRDKFEEIAWGRALLAGQEDEARLAGIIAEAAASYCGAGAEVVFIGHGTAHPANRAYVGLARSLAREGHARIQIGTVEAEPGMAAVMDQMEEAGTRKAVLFPLMVVAGDHAVRDIAGDGPGSWKSVLQSRGYEVECVMRGLGEYVEVRRMFADHARQALRCGMGCGVLTKEGGDWA